MATVHSILLAAAVGVVSFPLAAPAVEVGTPTERAMTDGIVALQAEVMLLVALDGYADPVPGALTQIHDRWSSYGEGMDRTDLIRYAIKRGLVGLDASDAPTREAI